MKSEKITRKEIINAIIKLTLLLFIVGLFISLIVDSYKEEPKKLDCRENYGGTIQAGYCNYVEDGNSYSKPMSQFGKETRK